MKTKTKRRYLAARALLAAQSEALAERDAEIETLRAQVRDLTYRLTEERLITEACTA